MENKKSGETCRICQKTFKSLKFKTPDIGICGRCVYHLNESPEPAIFAQNRIGEMLSRGMLRRAQADLESSEEWIRKRAAHRLSDMDSAVAGALPGWLTKLLADPSNSTKDFKMMRAFRRGLLRMDTTRFWSYPSDWPDRARRIRARDGMSCVFCGRSDLILDVHHIIYLSNFGTNQKSNLVTLCRPCHEGEHGREFDFGETDDPESMSPIQAPPGVKPPANFLANERPVIQATTTPLPESLPQRPTQAEANIPPIKVHAPTQAPLVTSLVQLPPQPIRTESVYRPNISPSPTPPVTEGASANNAQKEKDNAVGGNKTPPIQPPEMNDFTYFVFSVTIISVILVVLIKAILWAAN